jgi:hypothetical protein
MLLDMNDFMASRICYVKVRMFNQLKQTKINVLSVTEIVIDLRIIQHDLIFSVSFM